MNSLPLVTIITCVLNDKDHIGKTIESVKRQTYSNIEYIIVDGGSTDGTVSIIKSYASYVAFFISEKDDGIGDAWNKAISHAHGEIIGILNSGDYYDYDAVEKAVSYHVNDERCITYGIAKYIDKKGGVSSINDGTTLPRSIYEGMGFSHTTCFVSKKVYDEIGTFVKHLKIAMDIDFLLRAKKRGITFKRIQNVTNMALGGVSSQHKFLAWSEYYQALAENGFNRFLIMVFKTRRYAKLIIKSFLGKR